MLDSIVTDASGGLRDRALIGVLVYGFARIGAAFTMEVEDYFPEGRRWKLRLHEKGGKEHVVPRHHTLEEYLGADIAVAGIRDEKKGPSMESSAPRPAGRCPTVLSRNPKCGA